MTLCRRGRSVLVLTLVFGLVTASIIPAAAPDVCLTFSVTSPRIQSPGLPGNRPFAMASLQRRYVSQIGDDIGQISVPQPRIIMIGHRRVFPLPPPAPATTG